MMFPSIEFQDFDAMDEFHIKKNARYNGKTKKIFKNLE